MKIQLAKRYHECQDEQEIEYLEKTYPWLKETKLREHIQDKMDKDLKAMNDMANDSIPLYSLRMWTSKGWQELCLREAHQSIKENPDFILVVQQYRPLTSNLHPLQSLNAWQNYDAAYIHEVLRGFRDLNTVNCAHCAEPKYTPKQVFEDDLNANREENPHYVRYGEFKRKV